MGHFMKADLKIDNIYHINPEMLKNLGIKGILFDIDNTLEEYATETPSDKTIDFIKRLNDEGFKTGILSNAEEERADKFIKGFTGEDFNIYCCAKAGKPLKKGFAIMADKMNLNLNEIAMVGDQLYTDILGGNKAGCYTILVNPINVKIEPWFVRFKRFLEKPFM